MPVGVLARAMFGDNKDDADTRAAVETALQAELEDLSGAATKLCLLRLRVLDVALRRLVSTVADAAADHAARVPRTRQRRPGGASTASPSTWSRRWRNGWPSCGRPCHPLWRASFQQRLQRSAASRRTCRFSTTS